MTLHNAPSLLAQRNDPPSGWPSLVSLLAVPLVLLGIMWAMASPGAAIGTVAVAVAAVSLLRRGGPRLLRRLSDRTRRLTIPGIGTVEYRITAH